MENPNDENPEQGSESSNSLQDSIDRAKRAHELVDAVDLKKVAELQANLTKFITTAFE
jgi:hypothetical protein